MLRIVSGYSTPFMQRIPEITKLPASLILAFLFAETMVRYIYKPDVSRINSSVSSSDQIFSPMPKKNVEEIDHSLTLPLCKSAQITICLGSIRFFKSYWSFSRAIIAISLLGLIHSPKRFDEFAKELPPKFSFVPMLIKATLFSGNIIIKVVNSFAIGLLAQRTLFKDPNPGIIMAITTIATLALSSWNICKGWNDTSLKKTV